MCQQYIDVLGHRKAELALLSGILFAPNEALENGLIDELVDVDVDVDIVVGEDDVNNDANDDENENPMDINIIERSALKKANDFVRIPSDARAAVKELTRRPLIDTLIKDRERDIESFCIFVDYQAMTLVLQTGYIGESVVCFNDAPTAHFGSNTLLLI